MAESSAVAFGRYLRTLRERRGLSLDDVDSLSKAFPDAIGKANLSRCENGRQRLAFSKMIALSRIYEVPSEVLVERMELDLELDRIGGPDTEGMSFEELTEKGKEAAKHGEMWRAYGFLRDAIRIAKASPLLAAFSSPEEQAQSAVMNHSIPVARLGRHRLALFELEEIRSNCALSERFKATLYELLSQRFRSLEQVEKATALADAAVESALESKSPLTRAHTRSNKANLAYHCGNLTEAKELMQQAFTEYRDLGQVGESTRTLLNLAQVYFDLGQLNASKRSLFAAERLASANQLHRQRALLRILLGEIAKKENDSDRALRLWRESIDISRKLHDSVTRFKAEFQLYKHAIETNDSTMAAAMGRLLRRRANWVPTNVEELSEFRALSRLRDKSSVAARQHG